MTYYQLSFSSWMRFLRHRKDARIFQNRTTADILAEVFEGHSHAPGHYRFDLHGSGATHSYCTQYDSDHNFVHRLMESEGWFTYIEQAENGKSHTVVVTDDMYRFKPLDTQDVDFYRAERWTGADALVEWSSERIVQSVAYGMRTADYKRPSWPKERSGISTDEHCEVASELEIYEYAGHYSFPPAEGGTDRGSLAVQYSLEAYESRTKRFYGIGSVLCMDAGRLFHLKNHPEHDSDEAQDQEFATIAVDGSLVPQCSEIAVRRCSGPCAFRQSGNVARDGCGHHTDVHSVGRVLHLAVDVPRTGVARSGRARMYSSTATQTEGVAS